MVLLARGPWFVVLLSVTLVFAGGPQSKLDFIVGATRKITMVINNLYLRISPNGTVSGTEDIFSSFALLHRSSVAMGKVKFRGVASCLFLCMDRCGMLYAATEYNDECVFNEMIEQNNYNAYSSSKFSNENRTLYLALHRAGSPRRAIVRRGMKQGRLSTVTRVLTLTFPTKEAEEIARRGCAPRPPALKPGLPGKCRLRGKGGPGAKGGGKRGGAPQRRKCRAGETPPCFHPIKRKCGSVCLRRKQGRQKKLRQMEGGRVRHRKHRTLFLSEEDEEDDEATMTLDEEEILFEEESDLSFDTNHHQ